MTTVMKRWLSASLQGHQIRAPAAVTLATSVTLSIQLPSSQDDPPLSPDLGRQLSSTGRANAGTAKAIPPLLFVPAYWSQLIFCRIWGGGRTHAQEVCPSTAEASTNFAVAISNDGTATGRAASRTLLSCATVNEYVKPTDRPMECVGASTEDRGVSLGADHWLAP